MAPTRLRKSLAAAGAALLLVSLAGGCGRRGRLEPPPDPNAPVTKADATKTGLPRRPKNPPIRPPNEPFILDPLL